MDTKIIKIALYKDYLKAYTSDRKILKIETYCFNHGIFLKHNGEILHGGEVSKVLDQLVKFEKINFWNDELPSRLNVIQSIIYLRIHDRTKKNRVYRKCRFIGFCKKN